MSSEPPSGAHITHSQQYRRCNKSGCTRCAPDSPGHGPYWFAYWRENGKVRSRYLGRRAPPGVLCGADPGDGAIGGTAPIAQPWFRVRSLGRFEVMRGTTPVPAAAWRRRLVRTLFTCLLSAQGHRLHREQVMDALWPEATLPAATRELHRAMHALRVIVDRAGTVPSALRYEGEMIVLEPSGSSGMAPEWLDADVFARSATAALGRAEPGACREALARYGGDYLPDDPYSEWVVARRTDLQSRHLSVLLHLAHLSGSRGESEEEERCVRSVLQQDACHEGAAATLMRILASTGRRIDALRVYQALAMALQATMDLAPNGEIEALRARLHAEEAAPLAASLPPRGGWPAGAGNLPVPLTSFVGRVWEQREILALLEGSRLLTLTGPGGCGKTRLALEAAGRLHGRYPDGIWLVELATIQDDALIAPAVAAALGALDEMKGLAGTTLIAALGTFLRPHRALLLLDTCEHLLDAAAELATALLHACPGLTILATSREALGMAGETIWHVPPLAMPAADDDGLATLLDYEAVQLFVARAEASCPSFAVAHTNAPAVLQICRRLDGLPLALELAAARLGTMSVERLAARLHDCFGLLTGGNRAALPRQQTLRATLEWSYNLLPPGERALLRRLSAFAGGWTLEAAAAVCTDLDGDVPTIEIQGLIDKLTACSLVAVAEPLGTPRYSMLETTRQYAQEQSWLSGEAERIHGRHRRWYLDQVLQAGAAARTAAHAGWLDRLEQDLANLRVALTIRAGHPEEAEAVLLRAEPIAQLCLVRGHSEEGRRWLLAALAAGGTPAARAIALNAAGMLACEQGEYRQAMDLYTEGHILYTTLGDAHGAARVLINHGIVMKYQGEPDRARALYEAGCRLARIHDDPILLAVALNNLGTLAIERGDPVWATRVLEESLALKRRSGSQAGVIQVLVNLGEAARTCDDLPLASDRYEEALSLAHLLGDRSHVALLHYNLGLVAAAQGLHERAAAAFGAGLRQEQELGNKRQIAANLEGLAGIAVACDMPDRAGRLLGAAEHLREQIGAPVPTVDRPAHYRDLERVREALGSAGTTVAWSEGRAMGIDAAIAEALAIRGVPGAPEEAVRAGVAAPAARP